MLSAKSLGDILNEELRLWSDKLGLTDHWSRVEQAYFAVPERQRLIGGFILLVLGLLLAGRSLRRRGRPTAGQILRRRRASAGPEHEPSGASAASVPLAVPAEAHSGAYLVTEGRDSRRLSLASELVLIGRDEENDVRLRDSTVHRHHAAVHHTNEGEFIIKDLSGDGGNGVYVNGRRIGERPLASGDVVELGAVKLRFEKPRLGKRA